MCLGTYRNFGFMPACRMDPYVFFRAFVQQHPRLTKLLILGIFAAPLRIDCNCFATQLKLECFGIFPRITNVGMVVGFKPVLYINFVCVCACVCVSVCQWSGVLLYVFVYVCVVCIGTGT